MKRRTLLAFLYATIATAATACATPTNQAFVGTWTLTEAQLAGKEFPLATLNGAALHLTTDSYEFAGDRGKYITKQDAKPAQIDIYGVQGPNAGRAIHAIYQWQGDDLIVCYQLGSGPRPSAFVSPAGSQIFLVHYKRQH